MVPLKIDLPKGFLDEEVRCDYTVTRQMKEVWAVELDLAVQLLNVCKQHDIQVFADSGTLIGAARHKGFIPWDDDVDFCMLRSEYDRFCAIAASEFKEPYFFQTAYTDSGCLRGHAQLRNSLTTAILKAEENLNVDFNQGIFIDIFPLDEIADDGIIFERQKRKIDRFQNIYRSIDQYVYKKSKKNFIKGGMAKLVDRIYSRDKCYRKYEIALAESNGKQNEYLSALCLHTVNDKWLRSREAFDEVTYLSFEWMKFPTPYKYKHLLTDLYGDWHKFVRGGSSHGEVFFDTDNSYKKYLDGSLRMHANEEIRNCKL